MYIDPIKVVNLCQSLLMLLIVMGEWFDFMPL